MELSRYRSTAADLWTGRVDDPSDPLAARVHQVVQLCDFKDLEPSAHGDFVLIGFCCDEGVRRNWGRVGAAEGPWAIRKELAKFPANFHPDRSVYDIGDIHCEDGELRAAQDELSYVVERIVTLGYKPLVLGGGHETVFGHYRGLREACKGEERPPLLINLDAHLDLRSFEQGGTSGTSFYQIAKEHQSMGIPFEYICLGTQTYGNTKRLYQRAEELGVSVYDAKDISDDRKEQVLAQVQHEIAKHDSVYLTLDMDVIDSAYAPGVSSPTPFGMHPEIFLFLVKGILASNKVKSIDISEVSPRYDSDYQTAKLAAVTVYSIMNHWLRT